MRLGTSFVDVGRPSEQRWTDCHVWNCWRNCYVLLYWKFIPGSAGWGVIYVIVWENKQLGLNVLLRAWVRLYILRFFGGHFPPMLSAGYWVAACRVTCHKWFLSGFEDHPPHPGNWPWIWVDSGEITLFIKIRNMLREVVIFLSCVSLFWFLPIY